MTKTKINVDIDALNISITGLSPENLVQLKQSMLQCAEKLSAKHKCSPYLLTKRSRSFKQSLVLPLCSEFRYGKKNSEVPSMVVSTGYTYSFEDRLLIQFKGFPLTRYHYDIARLWFKYLTRQCDKRQGFEPSFHISVFHLATDFFRTLASLGVELRGTKKSIAFYENGELTGIGIGSLRSIIRILIYNRVKKLLASGSSAASNMTEPCTRIEKKIKLREPAHWRELISLVDKHITFDNLYIYNLDTLKTSEQLDGRLLNCIENLGAHQVIAAQQSDNERRKLRRLMANHRIDIQSDEYDWDYGPSIKQLKYFCNPYRKWIDKRGRCTKTEFIETFLK